MKFLFPYITNLAILWIIIFPGYSQTPGLDSLWNVYKKAKHDTTRINILLEGIGYDYESINTDSAIYYYEKAISIARKNGHKLLRYKSQEATALRYIGIVHWMHGNYDQAVIYYQNSFKTYEELAASGADHKTNRAAQVGMSNCYTNIGNVYADKGDYEQALAFYSRSYKIIDALGDEIERAGCYTNMGIVHYEQGNYDKAIDYFLKSVKIYEKSGNKKGMAQCYTNIGNVHYSQENFKQAIEYYIKSLKEKKDMGDTKGMAQCYTNIGTVLYSQGSYNPPNRDSLFIKANDYFFKSIKIFEELGDNKRVSVCYANIGNVFQEQGKFDIVHPDDRASFFRKAIEYYNKSLIIDEELDDKNGIATVWGNIAGLYILLADSVAINQGEKINYFNEAIVYGLKSIQLAKTINAVPRENCAAAYLQKAYKAIGKSSLALEYAEIFIATKDSMFKEEKTKALAEMEARYQAERKQLEIDKLEKQKALDNETIARKEAETKKQRIVIYSFVAGFLIILIFSIILYKLFRDKKRANEIILHKNHELEQANEEIKAQRDEIESQKDEITAQRDLVTEQKERIEGIHKELTDSIRYAKRIQSAVLPSPVQMDEFMGEHFVLFKPRNIVSGDFYWITRIKQWLIFCAADCTGHGVPGAFMSMLGISLLNEIVRKEEVTSADQVLNELRESIISALQQKGISGEQKDGMDIAFCVLNTETMVLEFAGANNPLYILRSDPHNPALNEFIEIKGDKMPVGMHAIMKPFTNHEVQIFKGDTIYTFTDGFADQFGGQAGRKFKYSQFKDLLDVIQEKPMTEQRIVLENMIEEWKGTCQQTDDILIIGLRI